MSEKEYRELFESLARNQLIEIAVKSAMDADRLRRELDDAQGVIR